MESKTPITNPDWLQFERLRWNEGYRAVAGVDEAGRGCLAGPVIAAAVIIPPGEDLPCVRDSKDMSPAEREACFEAIRASGAVWAVAASSVAWIDRVNILQATLRAMRLALLRLKTLPDYILIDGNRLPDDLPAPAEALIDGDARCRSIAAASVIAKVLRDRLMTRLDGLHPGYGFAQHKGYGTVEHREALNRWGPCPQHRFSFAPVREMELDFIGESNTKDTKDIK